MITIADLKELIADSRTPADERALYVQALKKMQGKAEASREKEQPITRKAPHRTEGGTIHVSIPFIQQDQRRTKITWGVGEDSEVEVLTEAEVRSRFVTALRDLRESKRWKQARFEECKSYTTFNRAVGYWEAIKAFWGRTPSRAELQIAYIYELPFNFVTRNIMPGYEIPG